MACIRPALELVFFCAIAYGKQKNPACFCVENTRLRNCMHTHIAVLLIKV